MATGVYTITNVLNNHRYVGSSGTVHGEIEQRWRNHIKLLNKNSHHSIYLQRAWNKYGENNFLFEIIEECEPNLCLRREQHYMDVLLPEYNMLKVAGSSLGRNLSPEQIAAIKNRSYDWMRGDNNWNRDPSRKAKLQKRFEKTNIRQYITKDTYKKISDSLKGRVKSTLHKENISKSLKKYKRTREHQEKINAGLKRWSMLNNSGENNYFYGKRYCGKNNYNFSGIFKFKNSDTNEEFVGSKVDFSNKFGLDHAKICAIVKGKRKSHKKWIFIQKVDNEKH